jgi:DNA invertase Pin-like site-specific DNA recombinase
VDMGGGIASLCLDQEDGTLSYPLTAEEGEAIGRWFRQGGNRPGQGRPPRPEDWAEVAELYNSDEAALAGNRTSYVAAQLGISRSTANYRIQKARAAGLTFALRTNGQAD